MKFPIALTALSMTTLLLSACSPKGGAAQSSPAPVQKMIGGKDASMPKATAFTMSGDYADKVAVTFDAGGNLIYYPAPSDITPQSAPYPLGDGWYLNRQGVSPNSVFTNWTFEEYAALPEAPSPAEIKKAVIPGATVINFITLPVSLSEAMSNPGACIEMIDK